MSSSPASAGRLGSRARPSALLRWTMSHRVARACKGLPCTLQVAYGASAGDAGSFSKQSDRMPYPPIPVVPSVLLAAAAKLGWRPVTRDPAGLELGELFSGDVAHHLIVAHGGIDGTWTL